MTATPKPDASSLQTWEDAFVQHTVPDVRVLERKLRADLAANKGKIRGIVGESYRDLLHTAEAIIAMDVAAKRAETLLGHASRTCNTRLLDRKAQNLKTFSSRASAEDRGKYGFAAQLAILQAVPGVLSRLLHHDRADNGRNCLLATKLFVVGRLLLKSLVDGNIGMPILDSLKGQLATFRRLFAAHIDELLAEETLAIDRLTEVLVAFAILKTSPPSEALRHFLLIRSRSLAGDSDNVLKQLSVVNQTLEAADLVFPAMLSGALLRLKATPLIQDPGLVEIPELTLDVHGVWLPGEIKGFVPWIKHDDLTKQKLVEQMSAWILKEVELLNQNMATTLAKTPEMGKVIDLRNGVFRLWRAGKKARSRFLTDAGETFRESINERMKDIVTTQVEELNGVGDKAEALLSGIQDEGPEESTSLWAPDLLKFDISAGAIKFREAISARVQGKEGTVKRLLKQYDAWLAQVEVSAVAIRNLRNTAYGIDDDEDFEAEEERVEEGLEDSEAGEKHICAVLDTAFHSLEADIKKLVDTYCTDDDVPEHDDSEASDWSTTEVDELRTKQLVFLLRIIRQIRHRPPQRPIALDTLPLISLAWFGKELMSVLHSRLAAAVTRGPLKALREKIKPRKWNTPVASKSLWEDGTVPTQPSTFMSRFLHELVLQMKAAGEDVWIPAAVDRVKDCARDGVWEVFEEDVLSGRDGTTVSPSHPSENEAETKQNEPDDLGTDASIGKISSQDPSESQNDGRPAPEDSTISAEKTEEPPQDHTQQKISDDWSVQLLLDALYLDEALGARNGKGRGRGGDKKTHPHAVVTLAGKFDGKVKLKVDEMLRINMEGKASEYWKRTWLLYALLG